MERLVHAGDGGGGSFAGSTTDASRAPKESMTPSLDKIHETIGQPEDKKRLTWYQHVIRGMVVCGFNTVTPWFAILGHAVFLGVYMTSSISASHWRLDQPYVLYTVDVVLRYLVVGYGGLCLGASMIWQEFFFANFAMFDVPLFVFLFGPQIGLRASGVRVSDQDTHYPAAYDASLILYSVSAEALASTLGLIPAVMMNCSPHASEYRTFIILGFPLVSAVTCAVALNQLYVDVTGISVGAAILFFIQAHVICSLSRLSLGAWPLPFIMDRIRRCDARIGWSSSLEHVKWLRWARAYDVFLAKLAGADIEFSPETLLPMGISIYVVGWIAGSLAVGYVAYALSGGGKELNIKALTLGYTTIICFIAFAWISIIIARANDAVTKQLISALVPEEVADSLRDDFVERIGYARARQKQAHRDSRILPEDRSFASAKPSKSKRTSRSRSQGLSVISTTSTGSGISIEEALRPSLASSSVEYGTGLRESSKSIISRTNTSLATECAWTRVTRGKDLVFLKKFDDVGVLFLDICDFTRLSGEISSLLMLRTIHRLFTALDAVASYKGIFKYTTIGDCYVSMSNVDGFGFTKSSTHAMDHLAFAITAIKIANQTLLDYDDKDPKDRVLSVTEEDRGEGKGEEDRIHETTEGFGHQPGRLPSSLSIRVGIHLGSITGGVVGATKQTVTCLGDTMNIASRMESTAPKNCIQISESFYKALPPEAQSLFTDHVKDIKGKGLTKTYELDPYAPEGFGGVTNLRTLGLDLMSDVEANAKISSFVQSGGRTL